MTSPEMPEIPAPQSSLLVIDAFIDGERIDLDALKDALSRPEGREHLVDCLSLREAVWTTTPRTFAGAERKRTAFERGVRWLAAAAGVVLSLTAGYLAGHETAQGAKASTEVTMIVDAPEPPVPVPTRVITLQPGVNWTERSGGR